MGEPFTMRTFAPPPIRLMWAGVEHLPAAPDPPRPGEPIFTFYR